jgi:hypothetical protein
MSTTRYGQQGELETVSRVMLSQPLREPYAFIYEYG